MILQEIIFWQNCIKTSKKGKKSIFSAQNLCLNWLTFIKSIIFFFFMCPFKYIHEKDNQGSENVEKTCKNHSKKYKKAEKDKNRYSELKTEVWTERLLVCMLWYYKESENNSLKSKTKKYEFFVTQCNQTVTKLNASMNASGYNTTFDDLMYCTCIFKVAQWSQNLDPRLGTQLMNLSFCVFIPQ